MRYIILWPIRPYSDETNGMFWNWIKYRIISNLLFVILFWIFIYVDFNCPYGLCSNYDSRHSLFDLDNSKNIFSFILLIFVCICIFVFPCIWVYVRMLFSTHSRSELYVPLNSFANSDRKDTEKIRNDIDNYHDIIGTYTLLHFLTVCVL